MMHVPADNWTLPGLAWAYRDPGQAHQLMPQEAQCIARAVPKRQRAFSAGRAAARDALAQLGIADASLPMDAHRAPIWPKGVCGSISHSDSQCVAIAALSNAFSGLGIDIEPVAPLASELQSSILRDGERAASDLEAMQIFTVKEAVYKAIFNRIGTIIDFADLRVERTANGTWRAQLCRAVPPFDAGQCFGASTHIWRGHYVSLCAIPAAGDLLC